MAKNEDPFIDQLTDDEEIEEEEVEEEAEEEEEEEEAEEEEEEEAALAPKKKAAAKAPAKAAKANSAAPAKVLKKKATPPPSEGEGEEEELIPAKPKKAKGEAKKPPVRKARYTPTTRVFATGTEGGGGPHKYIVGLAARRVKTGITIGEILERMPKEFVTPKGAELDESYIIGYISGCRRRGLLRLDTDE